MYLDASEATNSTAPLNSSAVTSAVTISNLSDTSLPSSGHPRAASVQYG